jgi:hypothetical protein
MTDQQNAVQYNFPTHVLVKSTIYDYFQYLESIEIYAVSSAC